MAIPDFQTLMRPLLAKIQDGKEYSVSETVTLLADDYQLTDAERRQLLPSGQQGVFSNRIAWAKAHFRMAGLVEPTARGVFRITERGKRLLTEQKDRIDLRVLREQPGYLEARSKKRDSANETVEDTPVETKTPEELIEDSYQTIREGLGSELLQRIKSGTPAFFEQLVVELVVNMGYGGTRQEAGKAIGRTGDEGVDGIINEDRLGLDTIYLQAKRWDATVGRPEIQKFAGALQGFRARKGIFITTSSFSQDAENYAAKIDSKIILIDGERLWGLMLETGVGVSTVSTYSIQKVDLDYFGGGS